MKPKSHIAILLSASLALALGACSSSSDDGPPRMMLDLTGLTPTEDWTPRRGRLSRSSRVTTSHHVRASPPTALPTARTCVSLPSPMTETSTTPAASPSPDGGEYSSPHDGTGKAHRSPSATMAVKDAIQALEDAKHRHRRWPMTRLETATTEVDSARTALATTDAIGAGQDAAIAKLMGAQADLPGGLESRVQRRGHRRAQSGRDRPDCGQE